MFGIDFKETKVTVFEVDGVEYKTTVGASTDLKAAGHRVKAIIPAVEVTWEGKTYTIPGLAWSDGTDVLKTAAALAKRRQEE